MKIKAVRGMHDYLPKDVVQWQYIEGILKTILNSYGYDEIRFPVVEFTELFKRSIGEVTDVVEKEMYAFIDQHGNDLTLRPEGTSGCVRAGVENSLFYHQEPRLWYMGPMFRRERPQKGRYRQFHQFSAEAFGHIGPDIDVELILITNRCWKELGISQCVTLELNSIGLLSSRIMYRKKLIDFLEKNKHSLDDNSIRRLYSNPMRILDTKNVKTRELLQDAPLLSDYLDDCSKDHFFNLCRLLDIAKISYIINPYLVRGLDYYNRTVFEWVTSKLGVKKTICAGGRYDDLIKQLGGSAVPAIGFAIGLERVLLLMNSIKNSVVNTQNTDIDVYLIRLDFCTQKYSMVLSEYIREKLPRLRLMVNHGGKNFEQQMNCAKKNNSRFVIIINNKNCSNKTVVFRQLQSKKQEILKHDELILKLRHIYNM